MPQERKKLWYTITELAKILAVPRATLAQAVRTGKLRTTRRSPRGHWRVYVPPPLPVLPSGRFRRFGADLYFETGVAIPEIKKKLSEIAQLIALLGPECALSKQPWLEYEKPLVSAVIKKGLYKRVKVYRVYRPGGKVWEFTHKAQADLFFLWFTLFDVSWEENPFSWHSEHPLVAQYFFESRIANLPSDIIPKDATAREHFAQWFTQGGWLTVLELGGKLFDSGCLEVVDYKRMLRIAPHEYLTKAVEKLGKDPSAAFGKFLTLTEKQRTILTAFLILRQKRSQSTRSAISKTDIRDEMERQWGIRLTISGLVKYFKRAPFLTQFIESLEGTGLAGTDEGTGKIGTSRGKPLGVREKDAQEIDTQKEEWWKEERGQHKFQR